MIKSSYCSFHEQKLIIIALLSSESSVNLKFSVLKSVSSTSLLFNFTVSYCILMKNTTFDYNFVNLSLNVTTFGVLIDNVGVDTLLEFGCYGNYYGGKL